MSNELTSNTPRGTLKSMLSSDAMKEQFAKALPRHLTAERFVRVAITALTRTPKLAECTQESFFRCLLDLSMYGIEPDGRRAHLIPYRDNRNNVTECQLILDWKGISELVMRSGLVSSIHADKVCDKDVFEVDRGKVIAHKIDYRSDRGEPYAYYVLVTFKDGSEKSEVMTKSDCEAIRKRSRAGNSGPWVTDFDEMAKKTVFRRASKWLPLSAEVRDLMDRDDDRLPDLRNVTPQNLANTNPLAIKAAPAPVEASTDSAMEEQPATNLDDLPEADWGEPATQS